MKAGIPGGPSKRQPLLVEAVNLAVLWRDMDRIAHANRELAPDTRGERPDPVHLDMQESVGAQMLGHIHPALPQPFGGGKPQMLRPNPDRRRPQLLRLRAVDEVHARRTDETGD